MHTKVYNIDEIIKRNYPSGHENSDQADLHSLLYKFDVSKEQYKVMLM